MATQKKKATGLGDTVEQVLEATGIAKVAKFVLGEDCNCEERKQKLNEWFPYRKPECLTEEEYNWLTETRILERETFKPTEVTRVREIYSRIMKIQYTQRFDYVVAAAMAPMAFGTRKVENE